MSQYYSMSEMNSQFRKFRDLLPKPNQEEFTEWYGDLFDSLANAETELAMQEYRDNQNRPLQRVAKEVRHPIDRPDLVQLKLGQLIELLEAVPDRTLPVTFEGLPGNSTLCLHSWRGFYEELAVDFELTNEITNIDEFITLLNRAIGTHFSGWKGDEFLMDEETPLWVATFGNSQGFHPKTESYHNTQAITGIAILSNKIEIQSAITSF